jgi:hypothetical protein
VFANSANTENLAEATKTVTINIKRFATPYNLGWGNPIPIFGQHNAPFPLAANANRIEGQWQIPEYVKRIRTIQITYKTVGATAGGTPVEGSVGISIPGSSWSGAVFSKQYTLKSVVLPVDFEIPFSETYSINFYAKGADGSPTGTYLPNTGGEITQINIVADISAIAYRD